MSERREVTAKELKVHTGEVLATVAEGGAVYVTRRGKRVARLEPVVDPLDPDALREAHRLIDELPGKYRDLLPGSADFARGKHAEERRRDRR